ncbi:hypothetical protein CS8_090910 [Cupriavidus sp. 8B]
MRFYVETLLPEESMGTEKPIESGTARILANFTHNVHLEIPRIREAIDT